MIGTNWSGNYRYRATALHEPAGLDELRAVVARGRPVRALGTRHTFTGIGDSEELISMERMPREISIDATAHTVSMSGHVTYAELADTLNRHDLALHSLASLPHISVVGGVATATHGSGDHAGNLATAVRHLQFVTGTGDLLEAHRGDERFEGLVVGLGALGIVSRLTLAVEPSYQMRQLVFEDVSWRVLFDRFDQITAAGQSVSVFHRFGERTEMVWIKLRADAPVDPGALAALVEGRPADGPRNPVPGADPANCTEQLGVPGPWSERLPHFRTGFTPSAGEEIQSEFFVARSDAAAAVEALRSLHEVIAPLLLVSELRTVAPDDLWLSPQYDRVCVGIHFTWRRRQEEVEEALRQVETVLAPYDARPHWGKLFTADAATVRSLYPRMDDFLRLRDQLDPDRVYVNDWLHGRLLATRDASAS